DSTLIFPVLICSGIGNFLPDYCLGFLWASCQTNQATAPRNTRVPPTVIKPASTTSSRNMVHSSTKHGFRLAPMFCGELTWVRVPEPVESRLRRKSHRH